MDQQPGILSFFSAPLAWPLEWASTAGEPGKVRMFKHAASPAPPVSSAYDERHARIMMPIPMGRAPGDQQSTLSPPPPPTVNSESRETRRAKVGHAGCKKNSAVPASSRTLRPCLKAPSTIDNLRFQIAQGSQVPKKKALSVSFSLRDAVPLTSTSSRCPTPRLPTPVQLAAAEAVRRAKGVRGMLVTGRTLLPAFEGESRIFWFPGGARHGADHSAADTGVPRP